MVAMSMPSVVMNNAAQRWVSLAWVGAAPAGAAARAVSGLMRSVMSARRSGGARASLAARPPFRPGPQHEGLNPLR